MKTSGAKAAFILMGLLFAFSALQMMAAQPTRFFRISGPTASHIIAFTPDGILIWSNALVGTNYTVQTTTLLPGGTNWVDYVQLPVTNALNENQIVSFNSPSGMTLIPAGMFIIGNVADTNSFGDAAPTNVYVSAFYMDINLVSSNLWATVYAYARSNGYGFDNVGSGKAANYPVETVNWYDCVKWCNARSQLAGLTPVYYTDAEMTQVYTNEDMDTVYANWMNSGYRLPTEAEWEKAARGGLSGQRFPWGNTISESQANYYSLNSGYDLGPYVGFNTNYFTFTFPCTSPVGAFDMNGYGLYDMAGNVSEWCWDWYAQPPYPSGSAYLGGADPHGAGPGSGFRAIRGGNWYFQSPYVRCDYRGYEYPSNSNISGVFGFRCVRRR